MELADYMTLSSRTVDPLLTMRSFRQPVATDGNGFRLFGGFGADLICH